MTDIETLEDAMGVISELLVLCKDQHNAAGNRLKDFDRNLESHLQRLGTEANHLKASVQLGVKSGVAASIDPVIKDYLKDTPKFVEAALGVTLKRLEASTDTAKQTVEAAEKANARLNRAVLTLGWKMAGIACAVALAVATPLYLVIEWQLHRLDVIQENIASHDALKGQIKILTCDGKPCVDVDKTAEYGGKGQHLFVLEGVKFDVKPKQ